jgi:hypothetical protein
LHPIIAEMVRGYQEPTRIEEIVEAFMCRNISREKAEEVLRGLTRTGVLVASRRVDCYTEDPERVMADINSVSGESLAKVAHSAAELSFAPARKRLEFVDRIAALFASSRRDLGLKNRSLPNAVIEDGYFAQPVDVSDAVVRVLSEQLTAALGPYVVERGDYRRLRDSFLALYGSGGVCENLSDLFSAAAVSDPVPDLPVQSWEPFPIAALVQVAEQGSSWLMVMNQLHLGGAAMSARMSFGEGSFSEKLRNAQRAWLTRIAGGREPVDVPVSGECNPLQSHPRLTDRTLAVFGEPMCSASLGIGDVLVSHNVHLNRLELKDRTGRGLHPAYLGGTVLSELSGSAYWLATLGRRYDVHRPGVQLSPPAADDDELVFLPRRSSGMVVLQRATWWIRADKLKRCWLQRRGALRLFDVAEYCRLRGLPLVMFARVVTVGGSGLLEGKPLWLDTRNPTCLDIFERFIEGASWIALTEALPDPSHAWPKCDGPAHAAEMLLEVLL